MKKSNELRVQIRGDPDGCGLDISGIRYSPTSELRVDLPAEDLLNIKKGWLMKQGLNKVCLAFKKEENEKREREKREEEVGMAQLNPFFCLGVEQALVCSERLRIDVLQGPLRGGQGHHGRRYRSEHRHCGHTASGREELRIPDCRKFK